MGPPDAAQWRHTEGHRKGRGPGELEGAARSPRGEELLPESTPALGQRNERNAGAQRPPPRTTEMSVRACVEKERGTAEDARGDAKDTLYTKPSPYCFCTLNTKVFILSSR